MKRVILATRPICPPWDEASKNFAFNLAKHIKNTELHILTCGRVENLPKNVIQEPIYNSPKFTFFQKVRLFNYLQLLRMDYNIVHHLATPTKFNSFMMRHFTLDRKVRTIQTIATLRTDLYSEKDLRKMLFADKLVTYSDHSLEKLKAMGFDNALRIYPGIDLEHFKPEPKDSEFLAHYNISADDFVVMYPGEYTRLGATDTIVESLLKIWEKKKSLGGNLKFIFGNRVKNKQDEKKKNEVAKLFEKKGFKDQVIFTDTVLEMNKLYNLADVVIFPAENMKGKFDVPLAIIEAYACGKPVILSDLEIFKEFSNDQISLTIKAGSSRQLVEAIETLHKNVKKRELLGKNARHYVEQQFNIQHNSELYERLYYSLI